ncbi:MAG: hypothetical protein ACT4TC_25960 [Myxococcaceae bacterium]
MRSAPSSWLTFLRSFALVVLLGQMTGLAHFGAELFEGAVEEDCGSCSDEEDGGMPCPPQCGACQGAHGVRVAAAFGGVISPPPRASTQATRPLLAGAPPEAPLLDGLFRPPRA